MTAAWRDNLLAQDEQIAALLRSAHRVAVLGIKTEAQQGQPAFYVPSYLQRSGYDIIPVPVYYPEVRQILGQPVHRSLSTIHPPIDLLIVFRRSVDVPAHVDDIIAARPAAVWFQTGIRHDPSAQRLAEAGIKVVQDRCAMVEHRYLR